MSSLSDRLNTEGETPTLREPDDLDNPNHEYAPFELEAARPLSQALGDYLTEPHWAGEDAEPDVVLQHAQNPELTVWIARYRASEGSAYVLTCWGWDHKMHFDVPKETVADVVEQASDSAYWTFDITDDELLERFVEDL
jgi:hypothetical protein